MGEFPIDELPLARRLALSYAPARVRAQVLALLALDERLAQAVSAASEPMLAQIKLAWWRERLQEGPEHWPEGEPLLSHLGSWPGLPAQLLPMVDGWECLLADGLSDAVLRDYAEGRASAWRSIGPAEQAEAVMHSARDWALADLALHLGNESEGKRVREMIGQEKVSRLPKELRSLAVLHGLTRRALAKGSVELLDGPAAGLVALRIGLMGR